MRQRGLALIEPSQRDSSLRLSMRGVRKQLDAMGAMMTTDADITHPITG